MVRESESYFAVTCKCGHVRKTNYIPITFPITAQNKKEAAAVARQFPRCKHHHKDCILDVKEIDYEEYLLLQAANSRDPYLTCKSKHEQNCYDLSDRIIKEERYNDEEFERTNKCFMFHKNQIRNPKKYFKGIDERRLYI